MSKDIKDGYKRGWAVAEEKMTRKDAVIKRCCQILRIEPILSRLSRSAAVDWHQPSLG